MSQLTPTVISSWKNANTIVSRRKLPLQKNLAPFSWKISSVSEMGTNIMKASPANIHKNLRTFIAFVSELLKFSKNMQIALQIAVSKK